MRILEVGCGKKKKAGAIGVDMVKTDATDVVCNIDGAFLPFKDNIFDQVRAVDVLEHVSDVRTIMEEIHRITKPGGEVYIRVPHFSSTHAYGDFTHKHFFNTESFNYFTGDFPDLDFYSKARYEKVDVRLNFWKLHRITGFAKFANRFPVFYEKYLPFIFTAMNIEVRLRVRK